MIGKIISHYKILEELGRGGMGVVYKAEDTKLKRSVALKFLPQYLTRDVEANKRFIQEAQTASALDHPNICTIYEIDETEDGQLFIVMAYYEGETLKEKIEDGPLDVDQALDIADQVAEGLREAHEKGIIHRDIKSANIMVTNKGQAKIMDFGLAKLAGQVGFTKTGTTLGTIAYMSPEQTRGEEVDHRSDIWSLGVVLYEMLTGQLPFRGEIEAARMYSIMNEDPEPVTGLRTGVPMELERITNKALAKRAVERYQHIDEMLVDLRTVRRQRATGVEEERPIKMKPPRKKPVYFYGILAALVALIVFAVIYLLPKQREGIDSIAVLPFEDLSPQKNQEYFVDGMTEALITELSQIKALRVISRRSVMRFRESTKPLPEIAGELGVDAIVEGSAMRDGEGVRITAQLIEAARDRHLWAKSYQGDFSDILSLQQQVAREISREIKVTVTPEEQARLVGESQVNLEAHEAYLKGRYLIEKWTQQDIKQGLVYFEQSIEHDANYAPAYVGLARGYEFMIWLGWLRPRDGWPLIEQRIQRALQIDESMAEAHLMLAEVKLLWAYNWEGAVLEYKKALELNPGFAFAHQEHAWCLSAMGRHDEAIAEIELAKKLDPLSVLVYDTAGWLYYHARLYDEMIDILQEEIKLDPDFAIAYMLLGAAYVEKNMYEEAVTELKKAVSLEGGNMPLSELARAYALSGQREKAYEILEELMHKSEYSYVPALYIATVYIGLGETDFALRWLDKAYEERSHDLITINVRPSFDSLRSDPRFTALLRKVGFE